jgi:hypothetical protein
MKKVEDKYIASDGREFDKELYCRNHESNMKYDSIKKRNAYLEPIFYQAYYMDSEETIDYKASNSEFGRTTLFGNTIKVGDWVLHWEEELGDDNGFKRYLVTVSELIEKLQKIIQ